MALHSTTTMADFTLPSVRQRMVQLHPPLSSDSKLPDLPERSPEVILEDDEQMKRLIRSTNNGTSSGPSGWGGNLLSSLVESDICRAGIVALLKDIINGNIPDEARQYLVASRLVGLNKPGGDVRPIAIGELFYRHHRSQGCCVCSDYGAHSPPVWCGSTQRCRAYHALHATLAL